MVQTYLTAFIIEKVTQHKLCHCSITLDVALTDSQVIVDGGWSNVDYRKRSNHKGSIIRYFDWIFFKFLDSGLDYSVHLAHPKILDWS